MFFEIIIIFLHFITNKIGLDIGCNCVWPQLSIVSSDTSHGISLKLQVDIIQLWPDYGGPSGPSALYNVQYTEYTIESTLYTVTCRVYTVLCTVYT